jgi:hypothetical protein
MLCPRRGGKAAAAVVRVAPSLSKSSVPVPVEIGDAGNVKTPEDRW